MTRQPLAPEIEAAIRYKAKEIAWDEGPLELSWESNHSCGMGRYGCCGGGKDVDREALAKLSEAKMREIAALAVSHTQKAEREALARVFDGADLDLWHGHDVRDYILSRSLPPAPDGSQEG